MNFSGDSIIIANLFASILDVVAIPLVYVISRFLETRSTLILLQVLTMIPLLLIWYLQERD